MKWVILDTSSLQTIKTVLAN